MTGGAAGKFAFGFDRLDVVQFAVSDHLRRFQPVQRFAFCRQAGMGRGQVRILFFEIIRSMPHHVSQQPTCFIIEIVAHGDRRKTFLNGQTIDHLPLYGTAHGTYFSSGAPADFGDCAAQGLYQGAARTLQLPRFDKASDSLAGGIREAVDAEVDMQAPGSITQFVQHGPQGQGILAAGDCYQQWLLRGDAKFSHSALHRGLKVV